MKQSRLDSLSDGIFAIVMTILVFEIHVPDFFGRISNQDLLMTIMSMYPLFLSYLLSFLLLFTYWRSHHYIASVLAKNIDIPFSNLNALFFVFVCLIPFSAATLGKFSHTQTSIILFAINVICIGLSLFWMRRYVLFSNTIENNPVTQVENEHAYTRILFPVFSAILAIVISFYNIELSLLLFTLAILFNLSTSSTTYTWKILNLFRKKQNANLL